MILLERIQDGDKKAYGSLFHAHYEALCRYAYQFHRSVEEAEDVVQEVFVLLWEKRKELDINTSLKAYLYRAVRNRCLNRQKHVKVRQMYAEDRKAAGAEVMQEEEVYSDLEPKLKEAIAQLPDACAQVFELSRFHGLRHKEIASTLDISPKTVENQIAKALKILRKALKDYLVGFFFLLWMH